MVWITLTQTKNRPKAAFRHAIREKERVVADKNATVFNVPDFYLLCTCGQVDQR